MSSLKKIIYIAPQIPSRSATFVYGEILALEAKNITIIPFSLHSSCLRDESEIIQSLIERTKLLYERSIFEIVKSPFEFAYKRPHSFFRALLILVSDIFYSVLQCGDFFKPIYHFLHATEIAKIAVNEDVTHIHAHFATAPLPIAMYASLLASIPFSITTHAVDIFAEKKLTGRYSERAKAVVTISEFNRNHLIDRGISSEKIHVIRCGIDTEKFEFFPKKNVNSPIKVVTLCRLVDKKGVDVLIDALEMLKTKNINFVCEIAGTGPLEKELINRCIAKGVDSETIFVGALPHSEVISWLQDADIFVLASKIQKDGDQDGIPVALMEAMAVGIPVVSTKISGIPELIDDGVSGFLAFPGDASSLAESISTLLVNLDSVPDMIKTAREKILNEFDININANNLIKLFLDDANRKSNS